MVKKFFLFAIILLAILPSVFAITMRQDVKYTISIADDTITHEVRLTPVLPSDQYFPYMEYYAQGEVLSAQQTGGKQCQKLDSIKSENGYTAFQCANQFTNGESIDLKIVTKCNCTEKRGIDLFVYPVNAGVSENQEGTVDETIYAPAGYFLFNNTIKSANAQETPEGITISMHDQLNENTSLYDLYGPVFLDLRRKVDFGNMKTLAEKKFTIVYPSGAEAEMGQLSKDIKTILPAAEKYAGTEFPHILVTIRNDSSSLGGFAGYTHTNNETIVMSIEGYDYAFPHEFCHLSEYSLYFKSWFSEGEATNCEFRHRTLLGRTDEAQTTSENYINNSKNNGTVDLQNWQPGDYYGENITGIDKGYGQSYMLFNELLKTVNMTAFYIKARNNFANYSYPLPNDAVICTMNNVSNSDVTPIFAKYNFAIKPCDEHTYDFIKSQKDSAFVVILGVLFLIAIILAVLAVVIGIPILLIRYIIGKVKGKKK